MATKYEELDRQKETQPLVGGLNQQTNEVKGIVLENIGKILKRGDNLDDLEKTTETLETEAEDFKKNTQKLYDKNCYEYYRCWIILAIIIAVVLLIVAVVLIAVLIPVLRR